MAVCGKCEGKKFYGGGVCNACGGTGLQDGRIPVPEDAPTPPRLPHKKNNGDRPPTSSKSD
jgi:hypothetical protein